MFPRVRWSLAALASAGLLAATSSTYVHYRLLVEPGYTSFCDINTAFSCTDLYLSRFGLVWGVPVALLGGLWFSLVFVLVVLGGRASSSLRENVPAYLFALSTVGLAAVLYLAYASFFLLKSACVLCIVVYASVAGIFLISGSATSFPMSTLPRRAARDLRALVTSPLALLVAVLFVAGAASAVAFFPREPLALEPASAEGQTGSEAQTEFERWWTTQPRETLPVPDEGARVLVVKFNDYQCPPCRQTYLNYNPVFAKYQSSHPDAVKFVTRDFPLDPECNRNAPNGTHLAACEAAVAVRLARQRNRAHEMEEWLFANQPTLTPAGVKQAARDIAGVEDFDRRYAETLDAVRADIALGGLLQVEATPTFFVNGVRIRGGLVPQYFDAAIAMELKRTERQ